MMSRAALIRLILASAAVLTGCGESAKEAVEQTATPLKLENDEPPLRWMAQDGERFRIASGTWTDSKGENRTEVVRLDSITGQTWRLSGNSGAEPIWLKIPETVETELEKARKAVQFWEDHNDGALIGTRSVDAEEAYRQLQQAKEALRLAIQEAE